MQSNPSPSWCQLWEPLLKESAHEEGAEGEGSDVIAKEVSHAA